MFSVAIPGRPVLLAPTATGPRADALVKISDIPIELGFRFDTMNDVTVAPDLLVSTRVRAYAMNRTSERISVALADANRAALWGATAGATALYSLAPGEAADTEEVTMLLRPQPDSPATLLAMVITKRFLRRSVAPTAWAIFNAGMMSSLRWASQPTDGRLWPESPWLEPGFPLRLTTDSQSLLPDVIGMFRRNSEVISELVPRLSNLATGSEGPYDFVEDADRNYLLEYLTEVVGTSELRRLWQSTLAAVHRGADLRGFAVFMLTAIAQSSDPA